MKSTVDRIREEMPEHIANGPDLERLHYMNIRLKQHADWCDEELGLIIDSIAFVGLTVGVDFDPEWGPAACVAYIASRLAKCNKQILDGVSVQDVE